MTEQNRFDSALRGILSVPKKEIMRQLAEDKKAKDAAGLRRYPKPSKSGEELAQGQSKRVGKNLQRP